MFLKLTGGSGLQEIDEIVSDGWTLTEHDQRAFPYLLLPSSGPSRNRARRRERGDLVRGARCSAASASVVSARCSSAAFWLTWQLADYEELGDYLLRLGLSWLFLTFLSFLAFSGVVTALSTFFLSDDLRLLLAAPVAARRLFHARFVRTLGQASWMVVIFLVPVLLGVGVARCAPPSFYLTAIAHGRAVRRHSGRASGTAVTLLLVNVFPARRARDILMLMGLLFAASIVMLLRFIQPERLLRVESLPDITDFFATLQSPITPLLPSFWAGETLFASLQGGRDLLHAAALWTTALGADAARARAAYERWYFAGYSKAQEAREGALHAAARRSIALARAAAAVRRAPAPADQGPEGLPARRQPVVAAPAAARAGARLSLQLPRARPRAHSVHERRHQERLRVRQPRDGRVRDGDRGRAVRVSGGVGRGRGVLDHPHRADLDARFPLVEVLDRARAGARADARG